MPPDSNNKRNDHLVFIFAIGNLARILITGGSKAAVPRGLFPQAAAAVDGRRCVSTFSCLVLLSQWHRAAIDARP